MSPIYRYSRLTSIFDYRYLLTYFFRLKDRTFGIDKKIARRCEWQKDKKKLKAKLSKRDDKTETACEAKNVDEVLVDYVKSGISCSENTTGVKEEIVSDEEPPLMNSFFDEDDDEETEIKSELGSDIEGKRCS